MDRLHRFAGGPRPAWKGWAYVLVAGRYRMTEQVGRGGMGEVGRATDELLDRPVALKLLLTGGDDRTAAERFRREAQTAARLNHPHVVAVYDAGIHDGRNFLVMELVDGHSLSQEIAEHTVLGPRPGSRLPIGWASFTETSRRAISS